ncbi:MAG: methyltransferase domain-containing protein [Gammaproteobacteria bacterium]|nr:methyltransferase domain-containing protein [Gammaproteobacteria bacterium]
MGCDTLKAYDIPERVRTYDIDMDVMHPLRHKMIEIVLDILPFNQEAALKVMDLGAGTGIFSARVLERFPNSNVTAIDGAAAMIDIAADRLGPMADRIHWVIADFRQLPAETLAADSYDLVISSYALHHLSADEKLALLKQVVGALKPGGWFLNADIAIAEDESIEKHLQQLRIEGVMSRATAGDERFVSAESTRTYLTEMELAENAQPQTAATDLEIIREAGLPAAEIFWKELREVVAGGPKLTSS